MDYIGVTVQSQKIFKTIIVFFAFSAHGFRLSLSDNTWKHISSLFSRDMSYCNIGIPAILACHSLGPVWWTEVPWLSTATVTGISFTSNS